MKAQLAIGVACMSLATALMLAPDNARSETVGAAAAVRPSSTGTPPGGGAKQLAVGTDIVSKERIRTTGTGSLQVMFNDKSTMTIGPNSDLVIGTFVYNPNAGSGAFAANLTKGALRFVGGQISHKAGATINTPVATLVIRGGAAFVKHNSACQAKLKAGVGRKDCTTIVCTGGACLVRSRLELPLVPAQDQPGRGDRRSRHRAIQRYLGDAERCREGRKWRAGDR